MNKAQSPIYVKINYENVFYAKRNILEMQMILLNILQDIERYREDRKREFVYKVRLKNLLKDAKKDVSKILDNAPKTEEMKQEEKIKKQRAMKKNKKEIELQHNIDEQLSEIKRKLQKME